MINEVLEVQGYLSGKNIVKNNLYRICCLLSKWFKEQGMNHLQIRTAIFKWAKDNNIYIKYNLNSIITNILSDKTRLKDNVVIKISKNDIEEISKRFDNKKTRLLALAVLCYAKAYANRDNEFTVSSVSLGSWLKISGQHVRLMIKELIDFEFISKIEVSNNNYKWNTEQKSNKYRIEVPIHNNGDFILTDNNVHKLYDKILS